MRSKSISAELTRKMRRYVDKQKQKGLAEALLEEAAAEIDRLDRDLERMHENPADVRYWERLYQEEVKRADALRKQIGEMRKR